MTDGRPAAETDATKGSAARPLSLRAVAKVDTLTRRGDPFAAYTEVAISLRYTRSRDADTSPTDAIAVARSNEHLLVLGRPRTGEKCLTVRDARRVAMCHHAYREAGEEANARECADLLDREALPDVLDTPGVVGP
jgi:hypothetical protein